MYVRMGLEGEILGVRRVNLCERRNRLSLCHNVFVTLGASMQLAPFPLPRVESLAPRERAETWIEQAACWSWVGGPKICSVNQP